MDDEEKTVSNLDKSSIEEVNDSIMGDKPLEMEELRNIEQHEFVAGSVPELNDSLLGSADSPIGTPVVESKTETGMNDSEVVGVEPVIVEKHEEAGVVEEGTTAADIKMGKVTEAMISGGEKYVYELGESQVVDESVIRAKENEAVAPEEESVAVDTKMEAAIVVGAEPGVVAKEDGVMEAEVAIGGGKKSDIELHDSHVVGAESLTIAEEVEHVVAEEVTVGEDTKLETVAIDGEDKFVPELDNTQFVGVESVNPAQGDKDNEMVVEEDISIDTKKGMETETDREVRKGGEWVPVAELDDSHLVGTVSPIAAQYDEHEPMVTDEEIPTADTEMETETEMVESGKGGGGKRKRASNSKSSGIAPAPKTIEEDVCFICYDGGDLVLCDRRSCPKAYHPSCVNHDEAFFRAKGHWNCGWHLCSSCGKNAYYMCYTCTFSLCKGCIKDAVIFCVRRNKGFCETCMKTVMLIENEEQANKETQVDSDDKNNWEYLFKDYWRDLKVKLSLSSVELAQVKNPWKRSNVLAGKQESPNEHFEANDDVRSGSDRSSEKLEASKSKRRKLKKRSKSFSREEDSISAAAAAAVGANETSTRDNTEWASKELFEFIMHMKNGDKSILSQFDVQALLLEYIKRNKLRDPRRKSQIICDARLENLFGKPRVGHFEMLKLLESHFLIKEDSHIYDIQGSVADSEVNQTEADGKTDTLVKGDKDRKRKTRKKNDGRGPQSNLDDYAAIDIHNISLIYLRRKLMEDLLVDIESFHERVVGTYVRIRISGSNQKQDIYRLVPVVGTSKAAEPYKLGKRTTDVMLEILNLNRTEVVSIDTISNQEFTEDECKRLRQSIKCGLINRLTVGDILDKAMEVQVARVNDWLETEVVRLNHLRDRASEKGRRKELRECVEKLQLLKTPEERQHKLDEIPRIHADPNMDPSYESEENDMETDDNKREVYMRSRGSGFSRRGKEPISPGSRDFSSKESWSGTRKNSSNNWELNKNSSFKNFSNKDEVATLVGEILNENPWNQGRGQDTQQTKNLEKPSSANNAETVGWNTHSGVKSELFSEAAVQINESEKMWHYLDPSGKFRGPFSMVQLRKWNNTGFFPVDLRIWRTTEKQDDSIPLTDALAGRFEKELPKSSALFSPHLSSDHALKPYETSLEQGIAARNTHSNSGPSSEYPGGSWRSQPDLGSSRWDSEYGSRNDLSNFPSPTPKQSTAGCTGGEASLLIGASSFPGGNGAMQSPAAATPIGGQLTCSTSVLNSGEQLMVNSENDSSSYYRGFTPAPNFPQGILMGSIDSLQTVQSVGSHNPSEGTHGWGSPSSEKLQPSSTIPVPGQPLAYDHWGSVPSAVQNHPGVFSTPGVSALPSSDSWSPRVQGNQVDMQNSALPSTETWSPQVQGNQANMHSSVVSNVPWGLDVVQNNTATGSMPVNPNTGWGTIQGNSNMGWGGPAPGVMNMNWGGAVQGPLPGNANTGWVMSTGNMGVTVQGPVSGNVNPGWVAPAGYPGGFVQPMPPGNGNAGWVMPTGNTGATVPAPIPGHGNPGWVRPAGNAGASVQGTTPPGGSQGSWGREQHHNGDRFLSPRDRSSQGGDSGFSGDRPWKRQSSFDSGGLGGSFRSLPKAQTVCLYHKNGHCRKGTSCDFLHN